MSICICSSCFIRSYLSICGHGYGSKSKTQKTPFFITQFFYNLPIAILMDIFMVCQTINHQLHIQISLRVLLLRFQYISSCLLAFISYLVCHWFCIQLKLLHTLTFGLLYLFSCLIYPILVAFIPLISLPDHPNFYPVVSQKIIPHYLIITVGKFYKTV